MIDFDSDFGEFFVTWTGFRYQPGGDDDTGAWVPGSTDPISFQAMPHQPVSGEEMQLVQLEDGQKVEDIRKTYTSFPLQTRNGDVNADILVDPKSGDQYEVNSVSDRDTLGDHYKVIIHKLQGDSGL